MLSFIRGCRIKSHKAQNLFSQFLFVGLISNRESLYTFNNYSSNGICSLQSTHILYTCNKTTHTLTSLVFCVYVGGRIQNTSNRAKRIRFPLPHRARRRRVYLNVMRFVVGNPSSQPASDKYMNRDGKCLKLTCFHPYRVG